MDLILTITELQNRLAEIRQRGQSLGFVPTMGALHQGHLSLMEKAKRENDRIVLSIFVNPTQFNNAEDLKNYPRNLETDLDMLREINPDFVFVPDIKEMYPEGVEYKIEMPPGGLENVMEGKHRPGHFEGVVQVVSKLFDIVQPYKAYFGEKDFQQLAIIRAMTLMSMPDIEIRACETVRESDGLAMSSRNTLLNSEQRKAVVKISKALYFVRDNFKNFPVHEIRNIAIDMIEEDGLLAVEYLELADESTLKPLHDWSQSSFVRVFTAVNAGNIRLIDNMPIHTAE